MSKADSSKISDNVAPSVTISLGPPRFAKVTVVAEGGIFKNGQAYAKGKKAVIELSAAQRFEAAGEVEIIEEVQDGGS